MNNYPISLNDLAKQVDAIQSVLKQVVNETGINPNQPLESLDKTGEIFVTMRNIETNNEVLLEKVEQTVKCNERHKKKILKHIKLKVDSFMNTYEKGARKTLFGNIQGSIFERFIVNAYEDLPYIVLPNVFEYIAKWIPSEEIEEKLEKWKIDYEQLDLFEEGDN